MRLLYSKQLRMTWSRRHLFLLGLAILLVVFLAVGLVGLDLDRILLPAFRLIRGRIEPVSSFESTINATKISRTESTNKAQAIPISAQLQRP